MHRVCQVIKNNHKLFLIIDLNIFTIALISLISHILVKNTIQLFSIVSFDRISIR